MTRGVESGQQVIRCLSGVRYGSVMGERLTPVTRGGLTDRVIHQLRERIAGGTWALHERIPVEAVLARELGVGRSTIREAVRVLVHAGQLEVRQGDGTYVRSRREIDAALRRRVMAADLLDGLEVRRALEVEIARLAALRRTDAELTTLRGLARRRAEVYEGSWSAYREADVALHEHLVGMTGNALLADLYRGFVDPLRAAMAADVDDAELMRDDPDRPETAELVAAIGDRDPVAAAAAVERHMDNAMRVLRLMEQVVVVGHRPRPH